MSLTDVRHGTDVEASTSGSAPLAEAQEVVFRGLERARARLVDLGLHVPKLEGKMLRPLVAYALVPSARRADLDEAFWLGALAIQMVHEASLLHDDILDDAPVRRGVRTESDSEGVGAALVLGDLYLTGSYRAAAQAGRPRFLQAFIEAAERTVAGEVAQGRMRGARLSPERYSAVVRGKSGALFGAAAVLAADVSEADLSERTDVGEQLGATYQRIDDLLDYCPAAETGKPPLQDYRQHKWTWVLDLLDGVTDFERPATAVVEALFTEGEGGDTPASRGLGDLRARCDAIVERTERLSPGDSIVPGLLDEWLALAHHAVLRQESVAVADDDPRPVSTSVGARARVLRRPSEEQGAEDEVRAFALRLGGPERWPDYFGHHARTFSLAARLFPEDPARVVTGVYAFCRFTDDLVDDPADRASRERLRARLAAWRGLTERSWAGEPTGIPLLDHVIRDSAERGVSGRYPTALLDGVAMDLDGATYTDWEALERYTFCVAGAVGGWLTQAFGIRDETLLGCAHALGHAMQLTNIARDVGEDWERGRVYLPLELLAAHDLEPVDLGMLPGLGAPMPPAYACVVEAVLSRADACYDRAWPAIRALPGWYARPVAAAASAYRGIHDEIRRNGYDNLTLRAHTSRPRKLWLAATGLARVLRPRVPGLEPTSVPEETTA